MLHLRGADDRGTCLRHGELTLVSDTGYTRSPPVDNTIEYLNPADDPRKR
jgi:hypothetical protein